jgi:HAD superfamily hydrolase (TIGR01450 family)
MDGTFYLGDKLLEGSLEFIEAVERSGRDFLFMTNNSSRDAGYYIKKLGRMGLNVSRHKVLTSGQAAASWAAKHFPGKSAFVLGNEYLISELAERLTINQASPDYIIIGYDTTLDYVKLTAVCDHVRAGLPYIATHPDLNCPTESGFAPDIGAIIAFIEASAGRLPDVIIGKPHSGIVDAALERTGRRPEELAVVGDRLYTDIEAGLRHGMTPILVLTGETTLEMLENSKTKPHMVYERLSGMIPRLFFAEEGRGPSG